jgi:hypothetical protein
MVLFYEGGLNYTEARNMPLTELLILNREAKAIRNERKAEAERIRKGVK